MIRSKNIRRNEKRLGYMTAPRQLHQGADILFVVVLVLIIILNVFIIYSNSLSNNNLTNELNTTRNDLQDNSSGSSSMPYTNPALSEVPQITGHCIYYDDEFTPPTRNRIWVMYNLLDDADKKVYNLFLDLVEHRNGQEYTNAIIISKQHLDELGSDHFWKIYDAMCYDHPEFFFLTRNPQMIDCQSITSDEYSTYIYTMKAVTKEESEQIEAFNNAAAEFLKDIDFSSNPEETELAIHDKLIDLVSYDNDLLTRIKEDESVYDLGFTAYGALVGNSSGTENTAVCIGYSLAFEHLCHMAGIPCCTITGGTSGVPLSSSYQTADDGHAWNSVKIADKWYEVDTTWDDYEYNESMDLSFYEAIQNDSEKYYNNTHHFYNRTTAEMENLVATDDTLFKVDGYMPYNTRSDTSHIRYTAITGNANDQDAFRNRLIPIAN